MTNYPKMGSNLTQQTDYQEGPIGHMENISERNLEIDHPESILDDAFSKVRLRQDIITSFSKKVNTFNRTPQRVVPMSKRDQLTGQLSAALVPSINTHREANESNLTSGNLNNQPSQVDGADISFS